MSKRIAKDDIDRFHDYKLHVPTRTIYMGSETFDSEGESGVDGLMAERFIKNITLLDSVSSEPITVLMNNVGGSEYDGFAIYDSIKTCKSLVTIKVFGHSMSMGSIIFQAADVRIMALTSRQMIHYGTWECGGHAKTAQKWSQEGLKIDKWMEKMYMAKIHEKMPEYTIEQLRALLDHDTFFTAQESVAMGLADQVLAETKKK